MILQMIVLFNLTKYKILDCRGRLLSENRIGETTERSGGFCGGTYYLVVRSNEKITIKFIQIKIPFIGEKSDFGTFE